MSRTQLLPILTAAFALACGDGAGPSDLAPATAQVRVKNDYFQSEHNGRENPAIDTVRVGGTVTWTWVEGGGYHSVEPATEGAFASSGVLIGAGRTYAVTFPNAGTFHYECGVHGFPMIGTVVVR
jgi:plastocyanin